MTVGRRFVLQAVAAAMTGAVGPHVLAGGAAKVKAVAFDAFPIFDPRSVVSLAETIVPGHGVTLVAAWRARQFDYAWWSSLAGTYQDFLTLSEAALVTTARDLKLDLAPEKRRQLIDALLVLKPWPDVEPVLTQLKSAGIKTAILSNLSPQMLSGCIASSGLGDRFDAVISTDRARTYKPDARAYQLGVDVLQLPKSEIAFVAFAGWDAFGAKSFGYPTYWNNRAGQAAESLGAPADVENAGLAPLLAFVGLG